MKSLNPIFVPDNSARHNPNTSANPQHLDLFPVLSGTLPLPLDVVDYHAARPNSAVFLKLSVAVCSDRVCSLQELQERCGYSWDFVSRDLKLLYTVFQTPNSNDRMWSFRCPRRTGCGCLDYLKGPLIVVGPDVVDYVPNSITPRESTLLGPSVYPGTDDHAKSTY